MLAYRVFSGALQSATRGWKLDALAQTGRLKSQCQTMCSMQTTLLPQLLPMLQQPTQARRVAITVSGKVNNLDHRTVTRVFCS
jgi:hypothetical protein